MSENNRTRLQQCLASGEARIQPLTYPQRELWEASPVAAGDVSNSICAIINIQGNLTPHGSEAALQKVVDRQEVFRLSFLPGREQPMQFIRKSGKPALKFYELAPSQRNMETVEELANDVFTQPFDLVQGPLYRATVFSLSPENHVLVLAIHHAIADGWTLGVFVQDLFAAYVWNLRGNGATLPLVPLTYSEWGAAERSFWQGAELQKRTTFWQNHLAGAGRLWPVAAGSKMQRQVTNVPADLGRALREQAKRQGTTLFTTLLASFQITISKWTGNDDIIVGTPVANRNKQAVRETAGYCSGIVPLRGHVDRSASFDQYLQSVHHTTVESFANAMPFVGLVRALGVVPAPGQNPVFQIRFALQNHPVPDVSMPGLSLQLRMRSTGTARFDLACEINEQGDALEITWLFRSEQFDPNNIARVGSDYLAVLRSICHSPDISISSLIATNS